LVNCAGKNNPHKEVVIPKAGDVKTFLETEKEAALPKAGDVKTFLGIEFVYIPSGSFIMGEYSGRFRHPIPIDSATLFRSIAPPHSKALRHPPVGVI
jgi:hypothetical protein